MPVSPWARVQLWWGTDANQRRVTMVLVALIVLYGALLRFDAVTLGYGPVVRPAWLRSLQQTRPVESALRPDGFTWPPVPKYPHADGSWTQYAGDSQTYIQYAREMRSFYDGHYREPVFVCSTKVFLDLLRNQDVAVSFASAAYSVLTIFLTYLLGAYAFSRWVGLGAALAVAVEYRLVSEGVIGVRDDAFVCAVLVTAWAFLRQARSPSRGRAILIGVLAGLAFLVRVFAAVFVVPGIAWLWLIDRRPWRARLRDTALITLTAVVVIAPYVINCWRVLGDPIPAFNVHAGIYGAVEGRAAGPKQSTATYILDQIRQRPMRVADTVALGLTTYPFLNKWTGFGLWAPGAGAVLSWAALIGLFLFAGSRDGRFLLVILLASLVPFAFTWKLISEWRFTQHAYPFFLIAAALAIGRAAWLLAPGNFTSTLGRRPSAKAVARWIGAAAGVIVIAWAIAWALPVLTRQEAIRSGEPITIIAGDRDYAFFSRGWSGTGSAGSVSWRVSQGAESVVRIPLPLVQAYSATVRFDPFPIPSDAGTAALPGVNVTLNGRPLASLDVRWNPDRVGSYEVSLPADCVRDGMNELGFVVEPKPGGPAAIRLWLVRVRPPGG